MSVISAVLEGQPTTPALKALSSILGGVMEVRADWLEGAPVVVIDTGAWDADRDAERRDLRRFFEIADAQGVTVSLYEGEVPFGMSPAPMRCTREKAFASLQDEPDEGPGTDLPITTVAAVLGGSPVKGALYALALAVGGKPKGLKGDWAAGRPVLTVDIPDIGQPEGLQAYQELLDWAGAHRVEVSFYEVGEDPLGFDAGKPLTRESLDARIDHAHAAYGESLMGDGADPD